jgi:RNA polymerase sigma factor (sigma-70 family)
VINLTDAQWQNLYRYGVALIGNQQDALDLLHSAVERWLRVTRTEVLNPEAYLRTVMRNLQYDRWRARQRRPEHIRLPDDDQHLASVISTAPQALEDVIINRAQLNAIWDQLTPEQRDILYLWAWLGYSTQAVADELHIPKGTVLAKIHRLRRALQAQTEPTRRATP